MHPRRIFARFSILVLFVTAVSIAQTPMIGSYERERGQQMLRIVVSELKDKYYDPKFRGIDLEARAAAADAKIRTAVSNGQIMGIIAQMLIEFDDSHTRFVPPSRASRTEYGWTLQMIGSNAFVTAVKPGSDADSKGLKVGDRIASIDGTQITRDNLWLMKYLYYSLRPQPGMRLKIQRPNSENEEEIVVLSKITQKKRFIDLANGADIFDLVREEENEDKVNRHRYTMLGDSVFVWKMPQFDLAEEQVDEMMDRARKSKSMILDLRGNGGGAVTTLNRLVGNLFDHDVKIADWKGRKKFDPQIAKTRGKNVYTGKITVLIDSESGSAAEIFARVMQLEKRGEVVGDLSSGKVMVSRMSPLKLGVDTVVFFGASITMADLIMTDGKSIEYVGVTPDKYLVPTQAAIAGILDPVLSFVAGTHGVNIDAAAAAKLFPLEWSR